MQGWSNATAVVNDANSGLSQHPFFSGFTSIPSNFSNTTFPPQSYTLATECNKKLRKEWVESLGIPDIFHVEQLAYCDFKEVVPLILKMKELQILEKTSGQKLEITIHNQLMEILKGWKDFEGFKQ